MKLQKKALTSMAAVSLWLCATVACATRVDISTVPVGSEVQITQQDGGVIEGALTARDETAVTVKTARGARRVLRADVADLQIVTRDHPATLPAIAKYREYVVPDDTKVQLSLTTAASSATSKSRPWSAMASPP